MQALHEHHAETMIVVLTGFASIATAVEAIKLGARHYLAKPSNTDDIEAAFGRDSGDAGSGAQRDRPTSIKTLEWKHIHETLAETGFNIFETARRLGMHRRTLGAQAGKTAGEVALGRVRRPHRAGLADSVRRTRWLRHPARIHRCAGRAGARNRTAGLASRLNCDGLS